MCMPDDTASSTYCLVAASKACTGSDSPLIHCEFITMLPEPSHCSTPLAEFSIKSPDVVVTVPVLTMAAVTLPVAVTSPAVLRLPTEALPEVVSVVPVMAALELILPPVMLPVALMVPAVDTLPNVPVPVVVIVVPVMAALETMLPPDTLPVAFTVPAVDTLPKVPVPVVVMVVPVMVLLLLTCGDDRLLRLLLCCI